MDIESMVDQGTIRVMGFVVLAIGLLHTLGSWRLARWVASHFRLSRRSEYPKPGQIETFRRLMFGWILLTGLMVMAVGAMWIAGVGTK
jgi:hypothetical protein